MNIFCLTEKVNLLRTDIVRSWVGQDRDRWGQNTPRRLVCADAPVGPWWPFGGTWRAPGRKPAMARCWHGQWLSYMLLIWIIKNFETANTLLKHLQVLIPCNIGGQHWALASVDLTFGRIYLFDPYRQAVTYKIRNAQVACLRWLLPSMLHAVHFHRNRRKGDKTYKNEAGPFRLFYVHADRVPQQSRGYDCLLILFYPIRFW